MRNYQEIFSKLKEETNAQDVNEMVKNFVEHEDTNYSLFNYLNVLSDEVENYTFMHLLNKYIKKLESLTKQKKKLQNEIEKHRKSEEDQRDPKLIKVKQIQAEIETSKTKKVKYEDKHKDLMKIINALKVHYNYNLSSFKGFTFYSQRLGFL